MLYQAGVFFMCAAVFTLEYNVIVTLAKPSRFGTLLLRVTIFMLWCLTESLMYIAGRML